MLVFGSHNIDDKSLRQEMKEEFGDLGKVTYRLMKGNWGVVSGKKGQTVFYGKMILVDGDFKTFQITYPATLADEYKPVVEKMAACFPDGHPGVEARVSQFPDALSSGE